MVNDGFGDVPIGTTLLEEVFAIALHGVSCDQNNWQIGCLSISFKKLRNLNTVHCLTTVYTVGQGNIHQDNVICSSLGNLHNLFHIFGMLDIQAAPLAENLGKNASINGID